SLREWYVREMGLAPRHVVRDLYSYLTTVDLTELLPKITAPTLVMVGKDALENTPERTRAQAELVQKGTCVEIPGVAEFAHVVEPERCFAIWFEFVQQARN